MKLMIPSGLLICLIICSCSSQMTIFCRNSPNGVSFTGFDTSELKSVQIRAYVKNSRYDSLVSSDTLYAGSGAVWFQDPHFAVINGVVADTLDYELSILPVGRIYRISKIEKEPEHQKTIRVPFGAKVDADCITNILSYSLDGVHVDNPSNQYYLSMVK